MRLLSTAFPMALLAAAAMTVAACEQRAPEPETPPATTPAPAQPAAEQPPAPTVGTAGRDTASQIEPGWITTKIQAQYFVSPEIKPWNIEVTTTSAGVVALRGEVETKEDKAEAVRIARATEGVTGVEDQLRIKGEPMPAPTDKRAMAEAAGGIEAPDAWLTAKIQAKYFLDDDVKGRMIDVDTRESVVTLSGTVVTEAERRQAVTLARNTEGVKNVVDKLQIRGEKTADAPAAVASAKIPPVDHINRDPWITTKIQSKYFLDPNVKGHDINVETKEGTVTLKGKVATEEQKREAERIAAETDGVTKVVNELVVEQR